MKFYAETEKTIEKNIQILSAKKENNLSRYDIDLIYRNVHTIKGNSRVLGYSFLNELAHDTETKYFSLNTSGGSFADEDLYTGQKALLDEMKYYYDIYIKNLKNLIKTSDQTTDELIKTCQSLTDNLLKDSLDKKSLHSLAKILNCFEFQDLKSILSNILFSIPSLAKECSVSEPLITINNPLGIIFEPSLFKPLSDSFMHLFRNSLDHGLEKDQERIKKNKDKTGAIQITLSKGEDHILITYKDDGRGLDLKILRKKLNIVETDKNISDEEIANSIFKSGLSTSKRLSKISGRGIGMDAVKNFLELKGGKISIEFIGKKDVLACQSFQFIISLPLSLAYVTKQTV